ncbi:MAG: sugar ABC transporter permease [Candidatus Promineifilaceae bacterium]
MKEAIPVEMIEDKESSRLRRIVRENLTAYVYVLPALIIYGVFFLYPAFRLILLSLQKWDGLKEPTFVGLGNYDALLHDPVFWKAFLNNSAWMLAAVIIPVFFGLMLAILLSRSPLHGRTLFRTIYFLPQVISSVVVAIIWNWIYNPSYGALNELLGFLGLESLQKGWLGDSGLALPAVFIAWSWVHYGFTMVIFIAALQSIDEVYFDAAKVDGANRWQQFRHVLVPFISAPLSTVVLVTAISSFQVFDLVFIMTSGGPANATMVLPVFMLDNAFKFNKVGYGASIAVTLGLFIIVMSILFLRARGVFKEAE